MGAAARLSDKPPLTVGAQEAQVKGDRGRDLRLLPARRSLSQS
jgi:hypothetical protein